jgi:dTDP-4-amino-4,6-dideoxy-D-galactose acyltransferase
MAGPVIPSDRALAHSPLAFLHEHGPALVEHLDVALARGVANGEIQVTGTDARWYWRELEWDSHYFGSKVIRLEQAAWEPSMVDADARLASVLRDLLKAARESHAQHYVFAELPASDLVLLRALGEAGFRLVETRLTYFLADASAFTWPERYPVRLAHDGDAPSLGRVASESRNPFDRYHADPFFGDHIADRYLATYAEACVTGLADFVLVPDPHDGAAPGAFFAVTCTAPPRCPFGWDHRCPIQIGVGRILLVAVGPTRTGWHLRLLVETTRLLAEQAVQVVSMTTQATNGAVIRNCEKLGFRLGRVTHVLANGWGRAR